MDGSKKYLFNIADTDEEMTLDVLGGKGFGLSRMVKAGVNVPPAFVMSTDLCREYMIDPQLVMGLVEKVYVPHIIETFTKQFGYMPLVSVRSGAKVSMPGMMDTILNVGLDKYTFDFWREKLGQECAADSYQRLVVMFGNVVNGLDRKSLEAETFEATYAAWADATKSTEWLAAEQQMVQAIEAVFKSWNNERAKIYRKLNSIPDDWGTAVVVQAMVFGNFNDKSCTGVLFTRNPSTGEDKVVGEYLINAQGEDVVAGIRTPSPLSGMQAWNPEVASELLATVEKLEKMARDMQDVEFTVQDGELFILQTRNGKRTAQAAVRIAVDLYSEGLIEAKEVFDRISLKQFLTSIRPTIDPSFKDAPHGTGIPASNGIATGVAVFSAADAVNCTEPCILIAEETTPDDIAGMNAAVGILTSTGGATSHAAVVARGMDKVCVVGCQALHKTQHGTWTLNTGDMPLAIHKGTRVTLDGATGRIWVNLHVPITGGADNGEVSKLADIAHNLAGTLPVKLEVGKGTPESFLFPTFHVEHLVGQKGWTGIFEEVLMHMKSGVIDLTPAYILESIADRSINSLFDPPADQMDLQVDMRVTGLINNAAATEGKDIKVLVKGGTLTPHQQSKLTMAGFKVLPTVNTLEDLIMATTGYIVPGSISAKADAITKVLALKEAAGEALKSLNITTSFDLATQGQSKVGVSAIADLPLLQSLLK